MKRLFVFTCPERLTEQKAEEYAVKFARVFAECGIDAKVLVLDGWGMHEIVSDQALIGPVTDD